MRIVETAVAKTNAVSKGEMLSDVMEIPYLSILWIIIVIFFKIKDYIELIKVLFKI